MKHLLWVCLLFPLFVFSQSLSKYVPASLVLKRAPVIPIASSKAFMHGSRNEKRIALTFDACATAPRSRYDSSIITTLLRTNTPATLFICGKFAVEHMNEMRFLARQPLFELGNHSFIHPRLSVVSAQRMKEELQLTQNILFTLSGKMPDLFRPPFGEENDSIVECAASLGMRTIQYDLASGDPDTSISAKRLINYVSAKAKNGSIIVMHMNKRGWHTAEALPEIIERLRKRGFEFVKVSDLQQ